MDSSNGAHRTYGLVRGNFVFSALAVSAAILLGCAAGYAFRAPPTVHAEPAEDSPEIVEHLRVREFSLADDKGQVWSALKLREEGKSPGLLFYDADGRQRLELGVDEHGTPKVVFTDSNRKARISIGLDVGSLPAIELRDEQGVLAARYGVDKFGEPFMTFYKGDEHASLVMSDGRLAVRSSRWEQGNKQVHFEIGEDNEPRLVAVDVPARTEEAEEE
jgi:hypothetical protein